MKEQMYTFDEQFTIAERASENTRAEFITKTYLHLFGAVMVFAALCGVFLNTPAILNGILSVFSFQWGPVLLIGGLILVSYVAQSWAQQSTSLGMQYAGLGLYVVAEAVIFTPLLFIADRMSQGAGFGEGIIETAAMVTLILFAGMTAIVFISRKNFSFLGPILCMVGFGAMALIVCAILFGFSLGIFFTVAMLTFACAFILYDTSNVLHTYRVNQYVAASLALFASVALLFWYAIRLVMSLQSRD